MKLVNIIKIISVGGIMVLKTYASNSAEDIYKEGPETLINKSTLIVAGNITNYSKQILTFSEPESEGIPLTWVIKGEIRNPIVLKGHTNMELIEFTRAEQSIILPRKRNIKAWEYNYGDLAKDDRVVLFLESDSASSVLKVIPSGEGERDLIGLIKDIVKIQCIDSTDKQIRQWLFYLEQSRKDEGRKAALRTLIQKSVKWKDLMSPLEQLMVNPSTNSNMRTFIFGIVTYAITEDYWIENQPQVGDFLCRHFLSEINPNQTLQYILNLKLILIYSYDESTNTMVKGIGQKAISCLQKRHKTESLDESVEQQYQEIQSQYPDHNLFNIK